MCGIFGFNPYKSCKCLFTKLSIKIVNFYHISALLWAFDMPSCELFVGLAQLELIADPYRFVFLIADTHEKIKQDLS